MLSFDIDTAPRLLLCGCCWKLAQKSAAQVVTVVMETTQLVLSQFKKLFIVVNGELCQK